MTFRTDDPSITIDPEETAPMPTQDEKDRVQARIDHDAAKEAQRPKTSRDARLDAIERDKRGDNAGQGASESRAKMIDRMKEQAQ